MAEALNETIKLCVLPSRSLSSADVLSWHKGASHWHWQQRLAQGRHCFVGRLDGQVWAASGGVRHEDAPCRAGRTLIGCP